MACLPLGVKTIPSSVLRIKQKLKKMDLTSLVSTEKKLTKVLYFLKGSIGKKRLQLKMNLTR